MGSIAGAAAEAAASAADGGELTTASGLPGPVMRYVAACDEAPTAGPLAAPEIGKGWALLLSDVEAFGRQERKVGRPPRSPTPPRSSS